MVGDPPEAQTAREVLLVELEVGILAGIAVVAAPHLQRRLGIADEGDRRSVAAARGDAVGRVRRARLVDGDRGRGLDRLLAHRNVVAIEEDGLAGGHQVRVRHEVFEAVRGQQFLDARAHLPVGAALAARRRRPLVARAVRALGQPDPARRDAEVALVRLDGRAQLHVDRLVAREQGEIAVGGGAGDDLDVAAALQLGEGARDVAADAAVQLPHPLVVLFPEVAECEVLRRAGVLELLAPLGARAPHVLVVERELFLELRRGQLLGEHGGEVQRPLRRDAVADESVGHLEQGEIALESGLGEPVAAVRPATVVDHHRKMSV